METVSDVIITSTDINTGRVSGLSQQIIAEMNLLVSNVLFNFEDLNVDFDSGEPGKKVNPFLQFSAKEALRTAMRDNPGKKLVINSAFRTVAQQHILFQLFKKGKVGLAAAPGLSNHEDGLALDIHNFRDWIDILDDYGWKYLGSKPDPWHFSFKGAGTRNDIGDIGVKAFQTLWNKNNPSNQQITVDGRFGKQTIVRMDQSPAKGFNRGRFLKLESPPMEGDDILRVKQALADAKFLFNTQVDKKYDDETRISVEKFQADRQLSVDGIVGSQTLKFLGIPA